jgi:hypothetical protein
MHLRIPTAINVDFVLVTEKRVSTTAWRSFLRNGLKMLPFLSLDIEAVKVVEGSSGVTKTTMASVDVDLILVDTRSHVGSWGRCTNGGGAVVQVCLRFLTDAAEFGFFVNVPPSVVKTSSSVVMTSEEENAISFWERDGNVLGSSRWKVTRNFYGFPVAFIFRCI